MSEVIQLSEDHYKKIQPEWKNPPKASDLSSEMQKANTEHSLRVSEIDRWRDLVEVKGSAKPKTAKNKSAVQPKLIMKQNEWRKATLTEPFLSTEDLFNFSPVTSEDTEAARQNELLINYQFNNLIDKVSFIDEYIGAAVDESTVIVKLSWDYEYEEIKTRFPLYSYRQNVTPQFVEKINYLLQLENESPSEFLALPDEDKESVAKTKEANAPIEAIIDGYTEEFEDIKVLKNQPNMEVCDYRKIIVDPTCGSNLDKANFIIEKFSTSYAELSREGDTYHNLKEAVANAENPNGVEGFEYVSMEWSQDDIRKPVVAYEYWGYWDIHDDGNAVPIVATWIGNVLIRLEENPYPDGKPPYVMVPYSPVKNSVYGRADAELLEDNQRITGSLMRGAIDIMAGSANGQMGIAKGALDPINRAKFDRGQHYEWNMGSIAHPESAIHMHKFPEIPNSVLTMMQLQNNEAEALTGTKAFHGGIGGNALGTTATGVRSALDATSKRDMVILNRLANGLVKCARKVMAMNAVFLSDTEVIRVTNEKFEVIRKDDLAGKMDIKISISTAEADEQKAQELSFILQTTAQTLPFDMTKDVLAEIVRLRKMPKLAKKILAYQPQPDPMQQAIQQLEAAKLEAEIAEIHANVDNKETAAILNRAKSITEMAKAKNLNSDTDLKDLAFVEQETGTNHERERDLANLNNQNQIQNKILENTLANSSESNTRTDNGLTDV